MRGKKKIHIRFLGFGISDKERIKDELNSRMIQIVEDDNKYDIQLVFVEDDIPPELKGVSVSNIPAVAISRIWNAEKVREIFSYGFSDFVYPDDIDRLSFAIQRELKIARARKFDRFYLRWLQEHDITTDFLNRYSFLSRVNDFLKKNLSSFCALYVISINYLDSMVLHLGRDFEDALVSSVAEKISKLLNPSVDIIGRISWDKFAVFRELKEDDFEDEARQFALDILRSSTGHTVVEGKLIRLSLSIGISIYPLDGQSIDELLKNAELALLHAKSEDTYSFCSDFTKDLMKRNSQIFSEIFESIGEGRFYLVFQPVVSLKDGRIHLFEALLRWRKRSVSPEQVIKIAEVSGAIYELSKFIFSKVIEVMQRYPKYRFSVNISPRHLITTKFYREIFSDFTKSGVEPSRLCFEISERSVYDDVMEARGYINELYKMGFDFAIDDFGSGQSSIAILRLIPASIIKVDKSIVHGALGNPSKLGGSGEFETGEFETVGMGSSGKRFEKYLLETIFFFSRNVNKMVAAEGVEKYEHMEGVRKLGFDLAQGFWISCPVNEDELDAVVLPFQSFE